MANFLYKVGEVVRITMMPGTNNYSNPCDLNSTDPDKVGMLDKSYRITKAYNKVGDGVSYIVYDFERPGDSTQAWAFYENCLTAESKFVGMKPGDKPTMSKLSESLTKYIEKYNDELITVAILFLADYYLFDSKFRTKLEELFTTALEKITAKAKAA